ncbi:MAG: hypothetical protein AB1505_34835 [Candidatus Latescibacterota bacterium]
MKDTLHATADSLRTAAARCSSVGLMAADDSDSLWQCLSRRDSLTRVLERLEGEHSWVAGLREAADVRLDLLRELRASRPALTDTLSAADKVRYFALSTAILQRDRTLTARHSRSLCDSLDLLLLSAEPVVLDPLGRRGLMKGGVPSCKEYGSPEVSFGVRNALRTLKGGDSDAALGFLHTARTAARRSSFRSSFGAERRVDSTFVVAAMEAEAPPSLLAAVCRTLAISACAQCDSIAPAACEALLSATYGIISTCKDYAEFGFDDLSAVDSLGVFLSRVDVRRPDGIAGTPR